MLTETSFIKTYLKPLCSSKGSLSLSDDAAILNPDPQQDIIISKDILIAGQHFFEIDDPKDIAYKALAVNLSDIAAKGAKPLSFMLGIAFPEAPGAKWAESFVQGLKMAMQQFDLSLLGGDTTGTKGPLVVSITIFGQIEKGRMVKRSGANIGDQIYVSGTLGDAALGFKLRADKEETKSWSLKNEEKVELLDRYLKPKPRCVLSKIIKEYASSSMDLSDGIVADLEKLCAASNCGAVIDYDQIPVSKPAQKLFFEDKVLKSHCLGWGDDYEILCTIPQKDSEVFANTLRTIEIPMTNIGQIESIEHGVIYRNENGGELSLKGQKFSHF
ncbi:thiamine-phosphate kinase [Hyphomicrobiales bacterium 4NK60-0047b]